MDFVQGRKGYLTAWAGGTTTYVLPTILAAFDQEWRFPPKYTLRGQEIVPPRCKHVPENMLCCKNSFDSFGLQQHTRDSNPLHALDVTYARAPSFQAPLRRGTCTWPLATAKGGGWGYLVFTWPCCRSTVLILQQYAGTENTVKKTPQPVDDMLSPPNNRNGGSRLEQNKRAQHEDIQERRGAAGCALLNTASWRHSLRSTAASASRITRTDLQPPPPVFLDTARVKVDTLCLKQPSFGKRAPSVILSVRAKLRVARGLHAIIRARYCRL